MRFQLVHTEKSGFRQSRVNRGACVTFAQDEPVSSVPFRIVSTVTHDIRVKNRDDIRH